MIRSDGSAGDGVSHVVEGHPYDFGDLFGHAVGDRGHFGCDLAPDPTGLLGQTGRVERVLNIEDFGLAGQGSTGHVNRMFAGAPHGRPDLAIVGIDDGLQADFLLLNVHAAAQDAPDPIGRALACSS